jgi:nicotinate-nucleotide--dimethylbenzimidazole phosphoribosyltransferase
MSDDKITRVIREVPPVSAGGADAGDEALRQARWDRRLEAARARRAQVLAERRARGDAQGKTLLSRKPWEDEAAPPSDPQPAPTPAPQPAPPQRPALRLVETPDTSPAPYDRAAPVGGVEAAVAAKARSRDERRAAAAVFEPLAAEEPSPRPASGRRRRIWPVALLGTAAVGGLAALGLLVATPTPDRDSGTAPAAAVTGNAVAETEAVDPPAPDAPVEVAAAVTAALAPPEGEAAPEVPAADAVPEGTTAPEEAPVEAAEAPAPAPAPAEPVLDAPRPIDIAGLEAIALAAPAAAGDATAALPGQSETPGPRTLPPPPLLAPADPALSGIGVRAQVAAPSLASGLAVTRAAEASGVATPAAAATRVAGAEAPRLAPPSQDALAAIPAPLAAVAQVGEAAVLPAAPGSAAEPDLQLPAVLAAVARPVPAEAPAASEAGPAPRVDAVPPAALPAPEAEVATEVAAAPEPAPEPAVEAAAEPSEEPAAIAEAAAEAPPPPRVDAVLVSILAPRDTAPERVAEAAGTIGGLGYTSREPAEVGVTIRQTQVRYYHPEDAAAAELVAAAVGGTARDFTDFRPQPPDGTVEVWLEGEPAPEPEPVRAAAPVRAAPAPAPAPPPPPQPSGYCWRGEPGTPGAMRVPIVDGRCAWP